MNQASPTRFQHGPGRNRGGGSASFQSSDAFDIYHRLPHRSATWAQFLVHPGPKFASLFDTDEGKEAGTDKHTTVRGLFFVHGIR